MQTRHDVQGVRRAPTGDAETKPFYMTSEFMVMAAMTVALFIASLALDDVDSRLAWILGVSLVGVYILSRGIAKAGSRSRSFDPREEFHPSRTDSRDDATTALRRERDTV